MKKEIFLGISLLQETEEEFSKDGLKFQGKKRYYEILGEKLKPFLTEFSEEDLFILATLLPYWGIHSVVIRTGKLDYQKIYEIFKIKRKDENGNGWGNELTKLLELNKKTSSELIEISKHIPLCDVWRSIIETNKLCKDGIFQVVKNSQYHWNVLPLVKEVYFSNHTSEELIQLLNEAEDFTKKKDVILRGNIVATGKLLDEKVRELVEDGWHDYIVQQALTLTDLSESLRQEITQWVEKSRISSNTRTYIHCEGGMGRH